MIMVDWVNFFNAINDWVIIQPNSRIIIRKLISTVNYKDHP